jgi:hypothetical protein
MSGESWFFRVAEDLRGDWAFAVGSKAKNEAIR